MIILYTRSAIHLAQLMGITPTPYTITQFSDGELYLKLEAGLTGQEVVIVCSTQAPAENLLELFFLLQAVTTAQPKSLTLIFSYFGYARQSVTQPSLAFITQTLTRFHPTKTIILHAHANEQLETIIPFTNTIGFDFFCAAARNYDVIAAPDQGAAALAQEVAQRCNKPFVLLHKKRTNPETVIIEAVNGEVQNKKVLLVDDIISTGNTLVQAARMLAQHGATTVAAAATHGIFTSGAHELLMQSGIEKIYVTNSLPQIPSTLVEVYDLGPFLKNLIDYYFL